MKIFDTFMQNRGLVLLLAKRDIQARYQGSMLGTAWMFATPLITLAVYTFVFSFVFQGSWQGIVQQNHKGYAVILFSGLILFNFFSECLNRAPSIVRDNVNYVKKVVFPLELLAVIYCLTALFQLAVNFLILLVFYCIIFGFPPLTALLLPVCIIPLFFAALAVFWLFGSLGVFLPDLRQLTGVLSIILMFMSPVFYSVSAIPEQYRFLMYFNPLTFILEQSKDLLFRGILPNPFAIFVAFIVTLIFAMMSYWWFEKTKKAFADVL